MNPQTALLDTLFPGFSLLSAALYKYLKIDITLYFPALFALGIIIFTSQYASDYFWDKMENYFMSTADIRVDDEMYNMFMSWVANQKFSKSARRFVPNTNVNSRSWLLWHFSRNDEDSDNEDESLESTDPMSSALKEEEEAFTIYPLLRHPLFLVQRPAPALQANPGPAAAVIYACERAGRNLGLKLRQKSHGA